MLEQELLLTHAAVYYRELYPSTHRFMFSCFHVFMFSCFMFMFMFMFMPNLAKP